MTKLKNAKHEAVLQAFVADKERVGWKAYAKIYPKSSQHACETAWSRLLKDAEFSARRDELLKQVTDKVVAATGVTIERVIAELAKIGFANMLDYACIEGSDLTLDFSNLTPDQAAAIGEISVETTVYGKDDNQREVTRTRFKLHDKRAALVDLGRELGMFKHRHEHTGKDGKPIETKDTTELSDLEIGRRILFTLEKAARAQRPGKSTKKG